MNLQFIVSGSHFSGTSLASQILYRSGLSLGDRLLPEGSRNPYGRFGDPEIVNLHEKILADNNLTWQVDGPPSPTVEGCHRQEMRNLVKKRTKEHKHWGFQDPRVCLFLEEWYRLMPEARILLVYEDPTEVCSSMHRWYADSLLRGQGRPRLQRRFWEVPDLALKVWLTHNRALLEFAHANPQDVIAVSLKMLREDFPLITTLNDRWGLGLRKTQTKGIVDVGSTVGRNRQSVSDKSFVAETLEVWEKLEVLSRETREVAGMYPASNERLSEEDFYIPSDAYSLLMENEFLGFKVGAREVGLKEAERTHQELRYQLNQVEKRLVPPQRMMKLEGAERDLRLIIGRMSRSRLAPLFRLKEEFRELEQRYLK